MRRRPAPCAAPLALALLSLACSRDTAVERTAQAATASSPAPGAEAVVVEGRDLSITLAEVERKVGVEALTALRQQEYDLRRQAVDELVGERLLAREAQARGIAVEELLRREVDDKTPPPDQAEVARLYEQTKARFPGQPKEQLMADIELALRGRGRDARREAYQRELARKAGIRVRLEPPRSEVPIPADAPSLGPAGAPITIVEFADYQCPYCKSAQQTVEQVLSKYGDKIRLVHRDFPLDGHPRARPASRAARCAGEQGKFWEYHRSLLLAPGDFGDADLRKRAEGLGLNLTSFETCLATPGGDAAIQAGLADGARVGVNGTPTFFLNGRRLSGARRLSEFERVIEEELERSTR